MQPYWVKHLKKCLHVFIVWKTHVMSDVSIAANMYIRDMCDNCVAYRS